MSKSLLGVGLIKRGLLGEGEKGSWSRAVICNTHYNCTYDDAMYRNNHSEALLKLTHKV